MSSGLFILESLGKRNPSAFTVMYVWDKQTHGRNTERTKVGRRQCDVFYVAVAPKNILYTGAL